MDDDDDNPSFFHRPNNNDVNSKIMLAAIISLSFVVTVVTILHIYARCVIRRHARRQAALLRLGFTATIHTVEPRTGLEPTVIAALPTSIFKLTNDHTSNDQTALIECSVCLSMFEDGEIARILPNCKHTFHSNCIDQWLSSNTTCPVCRTEAEPREGVVAAAAPPPPSAPPLEGTSGGGINQSSSKVVNGSSSRLSSFRKILGRERSSRRMEMHSCSRQEDQYGLADVERQ